MVRKFELMVSKEDVNYIDKVLKAAEIVIPVNQRGKIFGEIFSRKLTSYFADLEKSDEGIKNVRQITIKVMGCKIKEYFHPITGEKMTRKNLVEKQITLMITPILFQNFILEEDILSFEMKVNNSDWDDTEIVKRLPEREIKHIHEKKYVVNFPEVKIMDVKYWEKRFECFEADFFEASNKNKLIAWIFNVLKKNKLSNLTGRDAAFARVIYHRSCNIFPQFRNLPENLRFEYVKKGINKAIQFYSENSLIGPYAISKYILEELIKQRLHSNIFGKLQISHTYLRENKYSKKIDKIKYISYTNQIGRHTSYSPFQLCNLMTSSIYGTSENQPELF